MSKWMVKKKRFYRKRPQTIWRAINQLRRGVAINRLKTRKELKGYSTAFIDQDVKSTPAFHLLSDVDQGNGESTRDGNQIYAKYLQWRMELAPDTDLKTNVWRMIIFIDTESDGTAPTSTEYFGTAAPDMLYLRAFDATPRFITLMDKVFRANSTDNDFSFYKGFKKLNFLMDFDGATGSTDYRKNSLWLMWYSTDDTDYPVLSFRYKFMYTDV